MKWIEVIELRSAKENQKLLESRLCKLIDAVNSGSKKQTIRIYNRLLLDMICRVVINLLYYIKYSASRAPFFFKNILIFSVFAN